MSPGAPVLLYTRPGCPYCEAKRADLQRRGTPFREILSARPDVVPELLKLRRGQRIVPVIVDGGRIEIAPEGRVLVLASWGAVLQPAPPSRTCLTGAMAETYRPDEEVPP